MIAIFLYFLAIFAELIFAVGFSAFTISFIYSSLKGSPYVPTKNNVIDRILKNAKLKPGQIFLELGSGDGRVCRRAALEFKVKAVGVDINLFLVWYAELLNKLKKTQNARFYCKNIFDIDSSKADFIFLFLMPKLISQLLPKLENEMKKNAIVISHGFKIIGWEKRLIRKLDDNPFPTYYYRK